MLPLLQTWLLWFPTDLESNPEGSAVLKASTGPAPPLPASSCRLHLFPPSPALAFLEPPRSFLLTFWRLYDCTCWSLQERPCLPFFAGRPSHSPGLSLPGPSFRGPPCPAWSGGPLSLCLSPACFPRSPYPSLLLLCWLSFSVSPSAD